MGGFILTAFADEIAPDLQTQMDVLAEHGIGYIEMRGVNGKGLIQHSPAETKAIKRQLDERGFRISAIGSPLGKISITADFGPQLALVKHVIEQAKILETKYIRMFSFFIPAGTDPARYRDEVVRRWEAFVQTAAGTGLVLLHENEKAIYGDTAERCLDLLKALDCRDVKAVFDPANFVQCGVEAYPHAYELLRDEIVYLHIKDAVAGDGRVVPAGYGDGKVREILTALRQRDFEGFISLEPHLGAFTGSATLELDNKLGNSGRSATQNFLLALQALEEILARLGN